ncbi:MAG: RluA family pseudouridine synthase [Candidatus Aenigmatarchaeota archaeon]
MPFKEIIFSENRPSARLDIFLRDLFPHCSRRFIQKGIKKGKVLVNGRKAEKGYFLTAGERILIDEDYFREGRSLEPNPEVPMRVLYVDRWIVAVDKPALIPTNALDPEEKWTLANGLIYHFPETADVGERLCPGFVHRLDTGTSGVILAARDNQTYGFLRNLFRQKQIEKVYIAVVAGQMMGRGIISGFIGHDPADRRKMRIYSDPEEAKHYHARWAESSYEVIKSMEGFTLLRVIMKTGVMHQLRVQFSSIGHPVVGDYLYGYVNCGALKIPQGRFLLHAYQIVFSHPFERKKMRILSPLPPDFRGLLDHIHGVFIDRWSNGV